MKRRMDKSIIENEPKIDSGIDDLIRKDFDLDRAPESHMI